MRWWKRRKKRKLEVEAVFRKLADASFPGGSDQIAQEATEVAGLLQGRISQAQAKETLIHAKGRILIALRSASDDGEAVRRCADSIRLRWPRKFDQAAADEVASFAYRRLIEKDQQSRQPATTILADMTKEEAHLVARITAYRLARHLCRTNAEVQHGYNLDPTLYISQLAQRLFTHDFEGRPKKIETRRDAHNLCINVASTLVLSCYADSKDADSIPDPAEINRLAHEELELTLSALMRMEDLPSYSDFDPSEARAADDLQVPFNVALHLGEVGLLKCPPGPTESRRKSLSDALRRLQDP